MTLKAGREYRSLQDFNLVPREEGSEEYRVKGTAVVFDTPTVLFECDGIEYKEIIDRHAFDGCDLSDVIFNYNHGGKVVARLRNKPPLAHSYGERARYGGGAIRHTGGPGALRGNRRRVYRQNALFLFGTRGEIRLRYPYPHNSKVKKLYDVSAVDIPAYEETSISARSFFAEEHGKELAALEQARRRKKLIALTY